MAGKDQQISSMQMELEKSQKELNEVLEAAETLEKESNKTN